MPDTSDTQRSPSSLPRRGKKTGASAPTQNRLLPECDTDTGGYKITPMFEQYLAIKHEYPDALLFYRMGDFYELFFEDAVTTAKELQLTLTSRSRDTENPVPMCGVPWHAVDNYMAQLIAKGYNIAVCDQVEDPKLAKGLVKRAVSRVITPGTVIEDVNLTRNLHNFISALFVEKDEAGFVWADISTGEWSGTTVPAAEAWQWVLKFAPREIIVPDTLPLPEKEDMGSMRVVRRRRTVFDLRQAEERILDVQHVASLSALGIENAPLLVRACGALLSYLTQTQMQDPDHLMPFRPLDTGKYLLFDEVTGKNLELFVRLNGSRGKGTLLHVMDATLTPMGARRLEEMLRNPLRDRKAIAAIQDACEYLMADDSRREALRKSLAGVYDLERLSTRIHMNRAIPKDFIALRNSLAMLPGILMALRVGTAQDVPPVIGDILEGWDSMEDIAGELECALADPPPQVITDGGIFRQGYHPRVDELLDLVNNGEKKLQALQEEDQARTGLKLKLGNNRVFGYYYEISKGQTVSELPEDFIRRQTLVNGERYTTPGLKTLEDMLLHATDQRKSLEYQLFQELRSRVAACRDRLLAISARIAGLDYWQSLAEKARENGWTRPRLTDEPVLHIQEGRHPVVEEMIGQPNFVPNSFTLDKRRRLCLLTGPNMAGKSTVLRQVALICLMAQMGSFVPASQAETGIVDRLFSRVGASDNLAQGQSTFMVEMMETARILRQSTQRSLIILDEIGRGTSTYDGLALAWAVAEDLAQRYGGSLRTLFATHYHELTQLEGQIPGVFTMNIAIREYNREILFLHKLVPGPTDRSYGIEVARLAGVPRGVVSRARELLKRFETVREASTRSFHKVVVQGLLPGLDPGAVKGGRDAHPARTKAEPGVLTEPVLKEHPLLQILRDLNPETLTPMAALNLLVQWKGIWGTPGEDAPSGDLGYDDAGTDSRENGDA